MGKLNLSDLSNLPQLANEYNLCFSNSHYCYDGDLEQLFDDSNINEKGCILKAKEFKYDEDTYEPIGSNYGDYLETVILEQDGKEYLCQAFVENNGCGADYAFALENITENISCNKDDVLYAVKFFDDDGGFNMDSTSIFYFRNIDNAKAKLKDGYEESINDLIKMNDDYVVEENTEDSYSILVDGLVAHTGCISKLTIED